MEHNVETQHATKWSKLLLIIGIMYIASGVITMIPESLSIIAGVLALAFLGLWFSFPFVMYFDRKKVFAETDWSPSKAYYLGVLPGYLGVGAILLYLHRRHKAFERLERDDSSISSSESQSINDQNGNEENSVEKSGEYETEYSVFEDEETTSSEK